MKEKYDRNKVQLSFRRFSDFADDVMSSEHSTFDSNLKIFINHCGNDEIMSIICNQLKRDDTLLEKWWSENMSGTLHSPGGRKLNLPIDENERDSLLYQICLKVNDKEIDYRLFCINFTSNTHELLSFFIKVFLYPMVRSINYKLEEIMYDIETDLRNERYIPIRVFYVYQDFSTTVNGDVNTKGDAAIGEGASIEKKSII
jgi:hypothetical protein